MPRSVISPVTRRAGVTSNAGLPAGEASGEMRTWVTLPSAVLPHTSDTLVAAAFLDGNFPDAVSHRPVDGRRWQQT